MTERAASARTSVAMESGTHSWYQPSSTACPTCRAKRPGGLAPTPRPLSACSMALLYGYTAQAQVPSRPWERPPASLGQKGAVGGVRRFLGVGITQGLQMAQEFLALGLRDLDAREHPAIVRAVIAIVEQRDVPGGAHRLQEAQQRTGALREFEAEHEFIGQSAADAADHETHVEFCGLVGTHVDDAVTGRAQPRQYRGGILLARVEPEAHEQPGALRALVAVVEFRDVMLSEGAAEAEEASGLLGNIHAEQHFTAGADVGALGDMPQTIEIHVGAAADRHVALAGGRAAGDVALHAGDGERARRLEYGARILEHGLDRGADLVGIDQQDLIDVAARQRKGLLAHAPHRDAVGEQADPLERDALARAERFEHGGGVGRLDTHDAYARIELLDEGADAGDQAAPAHGHQDRIELTARLAGDFHADRALSGDHVRIIQGMHESQTLISRQP